jgi:hypothetical protein
MREGRGVGKPQGVGARGQLGLDDRLAVPLRTD